MKVFDNDDDRDNDCDVKVVDNGDDHENDCDVKVVDNADSYINQGDGFEDIKLKIAMIIMMTMMTISKLAKEKRIKIYNSIDLTPIIYVM